jgi:A/G-specific adenine glycosylase
MPEDRLQRADAVGLLAWYDGARRPLPWRFEEPDPYRVVVSELMLQQTRVETVLPRYPEFLRRFPSVESLAVAAEEEVVAAWSGLGYYRRARNLRALAREVVDRGEWPRTARGLRGLPGIGPYTGAAVASIVFGESVPVVDGNVERVLSRWLALERDPKGAAGRRHLEEAAGQWLAPDRAGDSNQALMEVGALLCRPRAPRCGACPLATSCRVVTQGLAAESFPRRRRRRRARRVALEVAVVERAERWLLFRRAATEPLLGGTWELPWAPAAGTQVELAAALGARYGGSWRLGEDLGGVAHSLTHRRLAVRVRRAALAAGDGAVGEGREARWVDDEELRRLPVSSLVGKVLDLAWDSDAGAAGTTPDSRHDRRPG